MNTQNILFICGGAFVGLTEIVRRRTTNHSIGFMQQDVRWYHAVAPEAGIILKYWRISLNYKIQYRYWLGYDPAVSDALGTTTHSIGVGIAW